MRCASSWASIRNSRIRAALKEVIVGAQNGKLYFMDLATGEYTRDPIDTTWPCNGSVSINTDGSPIAAFGQFYSIKVDKSRLDNGLHIYNLINNKELTLLNGRTKPIQTNYSGFSGAPLFDKNSSAMIAGGQNGGALPRRLTTRNSTTSAARWTSVPAYHRYTWTASGQDEKETNIDASIAMYGPYAYFGDAKGRPAMRGRQHRLKTCGRCAPAIRSKRPPRWI